MTCVEILIDCIIIRIILGFSSNKMVGVKTKVIVPIRGLSKNKTMAVKTKIIMVRCSRGISQCNSKFSLLIIKVVEWVREVTQRGLYCRYFT